MLRSFLEGSLLYLNLHGRCILATNINVFRLSYSPFQNYRREENVQFFWKENGPLCGPLKSTDCPTGNDVCSIGHGHSLRGTISSPPFKELLLVCSVLIKFHKVNVDTPFISSIYRLPV